MKKALAAAFVFCAVTLPLLAQRVLVVYDGEKEKSEAYVSSRFVLNLLGHFDLAEKSLLPLLEYRPGMVGNYDIVFLVFEEGSPPSLRALTRDLAWGESTIVWMHMHIEHLLAERSRTWGIEYVDELERDGWTVMYKGEDFAKEDRNLNVLRAAKAAAVQVLATARDNKGRTYPYVLRSDDLWVFADSPFSYALEGGRFLILADLLHEILGQDHVASRGALLRIEDVTPEDDPARLREIADYLHGREVPFQVSLVPIFRDPAEQSEVYLSDRPDMVDALHHAMSCGATLVLHGATHQHRGLSGDDYEFWNDITGVPIPHASPDWVDQRIALALKECFRNGLYPLAWETPHYSASQSDYAAIAKYFDVFYDRVMAAEISGTQQIFPYPVKHASLGVTLIPENLGYISLEKPDPDALLDLAKNMLAVRDGWASFFFHSFVPIKHLKRLVSGMTDLGWEFRSLRDFPCNVRTSSQWATSAGGRGRITAANQYVHRLLLDREGRMDREDFSENREKGIVEDTVSLTRGSLFVLEALDNLPEKRKISLLKRGAALFSRLFRKKEQVGALTITRACVLMNRTASPEEEFDQSSFQSVLRVFGFNPQVRDLKDFEGLALGDFSLLVVPYASARELSAEKANALLGFVEQGGILVTDGRTGLAERLGLRFLEDEVSVSAIKDLSLPAPDLRWSPAARVFPASLRDAVVLAEDAASDVPLALVKTLGRGRVLFLATLFDPFTPYGVSRFPYLPFYLKNSLGLPFNVRRNNLEFYFDPGFHQATSWEKLVRRWRASGVRIVYLAAWHFYRDYTFDYSHFIDLCHRNGIAAYAWFELPQVSPRFWQDHPQWREKTATGKDAQCHWRLQMNFVNPEARSAALAFFRDVLTRYDWDGVNLAELNYDTNKGAADPDKFTPLNDDVRRQFKERQGFDPLELFRPGSPFHWKRNGPAFARFLKYRTDLVRDLHVLFLREFESLKKATGRKMDVIVTALDSLLHPEVVEECGINTLDIVGLMDEFPFTLQVEDPARSWAGPPSRYLAYFDAYRSHVADTRRLMFDINCLGNRDIAAGTLPSALATGTELATTLYYATFPSGRAGIYSENTVHPFDMDLLPFVMGSDVEIGMSDGGYAVKAKAPFVLCLGDAGLLPVLNGRDWPFHGGEGMSVPSGSNILTFRKAGVLDLEVLAFKMAFDGDVRDLRREGNVYMLTYDSPVPVALSFSRPLSEVRVDSRVVESDQQSGSLVLPRGSHELRILTESSSSRVVGVVGYVTSSVFYVAGLLSISLLLGLYLYSKRMK